jgi:hypothetical protein
MSAKYDLYETPDVQNTGEQQPLLPALSQAEPTRKKSFWNVCPTLPKHLIIM